MDILTVSTNWSKAESLSNAFFIISGILFIAASFGLWKLGKTVLAKSYVIPALAAGILLLIIGVGLFISNNIRLKNLEKEYKKDATSFVQSEIKRVDKTIKEYETVALKIFPAIIAIAALLLIFVKSPVWRAVLITVISMLIVIIIIDSNAHSRLKDYKKELVIAEKEYILKKTAD